MGTNKFAIGYFHGEILPATVSRIIAGMNSKGAKENDDLLTNAIEPYGLRAGKPTWLTAKFYHPGIQRNTPLDVPAQQIEKFIGFSNRLTNPIKFYYAGHPFKFPSNIKIF